MPQLYRVAIQKVLNPKAKKHASSLGGGEGGEKEPRAGGEKGLQDLWGIFWLNSIPPAEEKVH